MFIYLCVSDRVVTGHLTSSYMGEDKHLLAEISKFSNLSSAPVSPSMDLLYSMFCTKYRQDCHFLYFPGNTTLKSLLKSSGLKCWQHTQKYPSFISDVETDLVFLIKKRSLTWSETNAKTLQQATWF